MSKPFRCLVGSFQQLNSETGKLDEFSRGDMIRLTDEEAAAHPGSFEPWNAVEPEADAPVAEPVAEPVEAEAETPVEAVEPAAQASPKKKK